MGIAVDPVFGESRARVHPGDRFTLVHGAVLLTVIGWAAQSVGVVTHGPMPEIRVIEYRTMKPGSDASGTGT